MNSSLETKNSNNLFESTKETKENERYLKREEELVSDTRNLPKLAKVDLTDTPNIFEGLTLLAN